MDQSDLREYVWVGMAENGPCFNFMFGIGFGSRSGHTSCVFVIVFDRDRFGRVVANESESFACLRHDVAVLVGK